MAENLNNFLLDYFNAAISFHSYIEYIDNVKSSLLPAVLTLVHLLNAAPALSFSIYRITYSLILPFGKFGICQLNIIHV